MMGIENKEKMFSFMMDMCCTGMSEEEKAKMKERMESCCTKMAAMMPQFKNMCKDMPEGFKSCCMQKDFFDFMKHCFSKAKRDTTKA
jgi:hypothetical protein